MDGLANVFRMPRSVRWAKRLLLFGLALGLNSGCSRLHFRERADADVEGLITQKNIFPDWQVENWHAYPDPRARFASPHDPDHPPYPPDDYAAWLVSPNPQKPNKKWGIGRFEGKEYLKQLEEWDATNRAEDEAEELRLNIKPLLQASWEEPQPEPLPNPETLLTPGDAPVPAAVDAYATLSGPGAAGYLFALKTDQKPFLIRLDQSMELALYNAREFQDRREDLYLAALPVSLERFGFATQVFAAQNAVRDFTGSERANAGGRWSLDTDITANRFLPTGAVLLFRFANQIVFDLTSGRPDIAVSNLSLTAIQPLLQGGGFPVTLENLTIAERNLLYAIRSYARFRKVFYVAIAGQGDYTNNPYGLQGLSTNLGRGVGNNLTAPRAGYLPTLLQASILANQQKNIVALEQFLRLYQNLKEGGGVNELQVVRVEQQLLRSRSQLLNSTRQFFDQLDNFKLQLGVPTSLPLELDDSPLRPMRRQLQKYEQVYAQLAQFVDKATEFDRQETPAAIRARWEQLLTNSSLVDGTPLSREYPEKIRALAALSTEALAARGQALVDERDRLLDARAERQLARQPETQADLKAIERVDAEIDLVELEQAFRNYENRPWMRFPQEQQELEQNLAYRLVSDAGLLVAIQARNQRLDIIRADWPDVPPICIENTDLLKVPLDEGYVKVGQVALVNRLDLMNARAQVVDSYRQIAVRANDLLGVLDVRYDLDTNTPFGDNTPFDFGGSRTRHALTLNVQPPFVRRAERNQYRAALIGYQRQRRTMMAYEDNILADVRSDLRQLRAVAETYRLQQRAVELAYSQVDNAQSTLLAPPDPAAARGAAGDVAALTQQLLEAQNTLLQAQNDLYTTWINYQTSRMTFALGLELLSLDARGTWIDDAFRCQPTDPSSPVPAEPGSNVPERLPQPQPSATRP